MSFVWKCCLFILGVALILPVVLVAEDRPTVPGGVKDKPYIKRAGRGTFVGGYVDHELFWNEKKKSRFRPFSTPVSPTWSGSVSRFGQNGKNKDFSNPIGF